MLIYAKKKLFYIVFYINKLVLIYNVHFYFVFSQGMLFKKVQE